MPKPDDHATCCAITGSSLEKEQMIKLVKSPQGVIVPDLECALPGEAVWVALDKEVIAKLTQPEALVALFGDQATLMPELQTRLPQIMRKQLLQWLAMSKKAGLLVVGGQKVKEVLLRGTVKLVFQAKGGSERELSKVMQGPYKSVPVSRLFESHELAGILGQNHIGYLALLKSELSEKIFKRCALLEKW